MTTRPLRRFPALTVLLLVVVAAVVGGGIAAYVKLSRARPAPYFASDEDHFLYGSIGTEAQGVPYWVWLVLPRVFPEHLPRPGGYATLGLLAKDGSEMPIGLSKVTIGYPRVALNCAACHTASVRARPDEAPTIVPAAPGHQFAAQEYLRFLYTCASDPRFTARNLLGEIAKNYKLSLLDRLLYRLVIIPRTRRALLRLGEARAWAQRNPDAGRGRADAVNAAKFGILRQPADATVGTADMMPLWNLARRRGGYGWDGLNPNLQEFVLASAAAVGTPAEWIDRDFDNWHNTTPEQLSSLRRLLNYIGNARPPKYPFSIDARLASSGAAVFERACGACHGAAGARGGTVVPAADIGTDSRRLDAWTAAAASAFNAYGVRHAWKFGAFAKTAGYVSLPLDGVWLRAPYLHNGSVPTLADLLEKADARPTRFWRGYDVYDPTKVGFVTSGPEAERQGSLFDITRPGNSNAGHSYGTELPADDKRALIEFLKTL